MVFWLRSDGVLIPGMWFVLIRYAFSGLARGWSCLSLFVSAIDTIGCLGIAFIYQVT